MGKRVTGKRKQRVELPMDNYIRKEKRGERKCKLVLKADENGSEDESHNGREGGRVNKPPLQKREYISAYKRAEIEYNAIIEKRQVEAQKRQLELEQKQLKREKNLSLKKKMNKALMYRTKKGQPKLDAQISVLLEKIETRMK